MRQRIYIETSIASYLAARPSRDLIVAAHQQVTREWWESQRGNFDLCVSQFVLDEAGRGDPTEAAKRLSIVNVFPRLPLTGEVYDVAAGLLSAGLLPPKADGDCLHIAVATVHEMDVLLTWNCRHLANAFIVAGVGRHLSERGYDVPVMCTPDEVTGE